MGPTISVIISIYNISSYISKCIESVLAQTYQPYEILLINDGSTDNSLKICRTYERKKPGLIKVLDKKNGGLSSARNAGIIASRGEYCFFLDGDDYVHHDTLKNFVDILSEFGDCDFIHGRMSFFYDGEENKQQFREQPYYINNSWAGGATSGQNAFVNAFTHQRFLQMGVRGLYNRFFLNTNNLLFVVKDIPWGEDEEWTPRVFLFAQKCVGTDRPYYYYREKRKGSSLIIFKLL